MCGLIGFVGKKKPDHNKIRLLGMYNRGRGMDSIGLYYNNEAKYGVKGTGDGDFHHFSSDYKFKEDADETYGHTLLLHNRAASSGTVSLENAHPFLRTEKDNADAPTLVFMHNGTINKEYELSKEFNIPFNSYKVDSEIFANYLFENRGKYEIFERYHGSATCAWTWTDEPNTAYVWKGASYPEEGAKDKYVERPLYYYYDDTDEGIYFCSVIDGLKAVSNQKEVFSFPSNTILKIVEGEIVERIEMKRDLINEDYMSYQGKHARTHENYVYKNTGYSNNNTGSYNNYNRNTNNSKSTDVVPIRSYKKANYNKSVTKLVVPTPQNKFKGDAIYYHMGKVYRNGHPLNGELRIDDKYRITENKVFTKRYFYNGVELKDYKALNRAMTMKSITYREIEKSFLYNNNNDLWFKNSNFVKDAVITPEFSPYTYHFKGAKLDKYTENKYYEETIKEKDKFPFDDDIFEVDHINTLKEIVEEATDLAQAGCEDAITRIFTDFPEISNAINDLDTDILNPDNKTLSDDLKQNIKLLWIIAYTVWCPEIVDVLYNSYEEYIVPLNKNY